MCGCGRSFCSLLVVGQRRLAWSSWCSFGGECPEARWCLDGPGIIFCIAIGTVHLTPTYLFQPQITPKYPAPPHPQAHPRVFFVVIRCSRCNSYERTSTHRRAGHGIRLGGCRVVPHLWGGGVLQISGKPTDPQISHPQGGGGGGAVGHPPNDHRQNAVTSAFGADPKSPTRAYPTGGGGGGAVGHPPPQKL